MTAVTAVVTSSMTLAKFTLQTFNATATSAFKRAVALTANKAPSDVNINSVTAAAASSRHLLQTGVTVAFSIAAGSDADAASVMTALSASTATHTLAYHMTNAGIPVNAAELILTPPVKVIPSAAAFIKKPGGVHQAVAFSATALLAAHALF